MTAMLPEIVIIGSAFLVIFLDLALNERRRSIIAPVVMGALGFAALLLIFFTPQNGSLFGGRFVVDPVVWYFKLFFILSALLTVAISTDMLDGRTKVKVPGLGYRGEYYTVLLFTVAGAMFLISATDIVTMYISLELATIPLFLLAAWQKNSKLSGEAGLKYVVLGALASAFILYGLGIIYGIGGSTSIAEIARNIKPSYAFWAGFVFITVGIGFKLTLVPFHMWAADVYQGAPIPVTAYLSVASKGAGLAFMFQIFFRMTGHFVNDLSPLLAVLATLTMTLGNTVAIVQQNIKRFMAFSAISQAGYLILGFLGPANEGVPAMLFYMLIYIFSNLAVFAGIVFYANATGRENIKDYRGLSRTNPMVSLAIMLGLFSLAGVPPFAGFVGKFFLFSVASKAGYNWLVAVGAVNSTISLYYYLRVVRQMYIEDPFEGAKSLPVSPVIGGTLLVTGLASVLLGLIPFFYDVIHMDTINWLAVVLR